MLDVYKYHTSPVQLDGYYEKFWYESILSIVKEYSDKYEVRDVKRVIITALHPNDVTIYDRTKYTQMIGKLVKEGDVIKCLDPQGYEVTQFAYNLPVDEVALKMRPYMNWILEGEE